VIGALLPLLLAQAAPIPAPVENGLQPAMRFACRLTGPSGWTHVQGRIRRFYLKTPPGAGLLVMAEPGGYRDHIVLEIDPSGVPGLAGRFNTEARFPNGTDKMVVGLPAAIEGGAYVFTASPARSGGGYQAFTSLRIEQPGSDGATWAGPCTTILPKLEKTS
jgi:hypothetical protein